MLKALIALLLAVSLPSQVVGTDIVPSGSGYALTPGTAWQPCSGGVSTNVTTLPTSGFGQATPGGFINWRITRLDVAPTLLLACADSGTSIAFLSVGLTRADTVVTAAVTNDRDALVVPDVAATFLMAFDPTTGVEWVHSEAIPNNPALVGLRLWYQASDWWQDAGVQKINVRRATEVTIQ